MKTPTEWMPNDIATDCLWYDEYMGNETCVYHGCSLGVDENSPCFLCKNYMIYEPGTGRNKDYARLLFSDAPTDRNGQYYILGM